MTSWICVKLLENIFRDTDFQNFYSIGSDKVVISWFLTSEILWIFLNYVKIKQFLMTSFPVDNDVIGGQACVALKILGLTFISHKNFWISTIQFFSGSRYMRATFQFSITKKKRSKIAQIQYLKGVFRQIDYAESREHISFGREFWSEDSQF